MLQSDVWQDDPAQATHAGIETSAATRFAATGITAYLKKGGKLEIARQMAYQSARALRPAFRRDLAKDCLVWWAVVA